jgi:hypothetical protein
MMSIGMTKARPWIGEYYAESRILIVGESNWGVGTMTDDEYVRHWLEHPNFTRHRDCGVCVRVGGKTYPRDRLNDALTTMMVNWRPVTDASRRAAWAHVAFVNFIGREVPTLDAEDRPTDDDWSKAERDFPALLRKLNPTPRACLVLDNPKGQLLRAVKSSLRAMGTEVHRLPHLTMRPAPKKEVRKDAWRAVKEMTV